MMGLGRPFLGHLLAATALSTFISLTIQAQTDTVAVFNVPESSLRKALQQFAKQAGLSLSHPRLLGRKTTSKSLSGSMTIEAALQELLDGTQLSYEFLSGTSVRLFVKPAEPDLEHTFQVGVTPALEDIEVSAS